MNASLQDVLQVFSEEDREFNQRMVEKGNQVSNVVRGNLYVGSLGGKVLRENYFDSHSEEDYDFTSELLKNY